MSAPSPNHGERRGAQVPDIIVIHYTGMMDAAAARARLCDPMAEVSAHWLIDECGRTEALVSEDRRAWHAGVGSWRGRDDVNSRSIGIELANPGDRPFPAPQMAALEDLLVGIMARWPVSPPRVIAHSDMAPDRKSDPGPRFDWARLARRGLALAPTEGAPGGDLTTLLDRIGYPPADTDARLAAFRLRFAPWHEGAETQADVDLAAAVLAARDAPVFKVLRADEWAALQQDGETAGAPVDLADGFIHLSTAAQLPVTLSKHFAGATDLHLLACEPDALDPDLRWEVSRGGVMFPHLYRRLRLSDVAWHRPVAADPADERMTPCG